MNTDYLIIYLLFVHFVADFVLQTNWMATNKSKNWIALTSHVFVYFGASLALLGISSNQLFGVADSRMLVFFVAINSLAHFFIDAVTSRITSHLWKKGDTHNFFVVIGFDQFCHTAIIVLTYKWLLL